mmetsp:Transcript_83288/g.145066  ORF Transcript_83288/g.145066 Transcript_83288/m.145066 type:complete len:100 (+) Transcript_83288:257-556(+)
MHGTSVIVTTRALYILELQSPASLYFFCESLQAVFHVSVARHKLPFNCIQTQDVLAPHCQTEVLLVHWRPPASVEVNKDSGAHGSVPVCEASSRALHGR